MNRSGKTNILILGPSIEKCPGGMSEYIKWLSSEKYLSEKYSFKYIPTHAEGTTIYKLLFDFGSFFKFLQDVSGSDIVHIHASGRSSLLRKSMYAIVSWLLRRRVILHLHSFDLDSYVRNAHPIMNAAIGNVFKVPNSVIALSTYWANVICCLTGGDNIRVIGNPVDTTVFRADNNARKGKRLLYNGRIEERKGAFDLIQVVSSLSKRFLGIKLIMNGDGDIERAKQLVDSLGLNSVIEICGWADRKKIEHDLAVSDIFILPSYAEGFPMALLEAMSSSLPIVTTNIGAIRAVVDDSYAALVTPGNLEEIEEMVADLIENHSKRREMGENARKEVEMKYDTTNIAKQLDIVYRELLLD